MERTECLPDYDLYSLGDVRYAFLPTKMGIEQARKACGIRFGKFKL